jgi:hypothetical protein
LLSISMEFAGASSVESARLAGNDCFQQGDYAGAITFYSNAAKLARHHDTPAFITCQSNMAQAMLNMSDFAGAIACASRAIEVDPFCIKALFRRARAKARIGQYSGAEADLVLASEADPASKQVSTELIRVRGMLGGGTQAAGKHTAAGDALLLPAKKMQKEIIRRVESGIVTVISGETGCGKSSQVPQMLSEYFGGKILCTQPRRLAVIGVSSRVAAERGCELGQEVGYVIGQRRHVTSKSSLVFSTAGVVLEELRAHGASALEPYSILVLDECHERSVESDLLLACLKQLLMPGAGALRCRLVLMSATFDQRRFADYFYAIDSAVRAVTIPASRGVGFHTQEFYMENVINLLEKKSRLDTGAVCTYRSAMRELESSPRAGESALHASMYDMLADLVQLLDAELHPTESILVFLPTYRALETAYALLARRFTVITAAHGSASAPAPAPGWGGEDRTDIAVAVLHSSVDVEKCLEECNAKPDFVRKVFLSSNIGESSITIPSCACVIDLCRSLRCVCVCVCVCVRVCVYMCVHVCVHVYMYRSSSSSSSSSSTSVVLVLV